MKAIEVLIVTINKTRDEVIKLIRSMNIQTSAIVCNQNGDWRCEKISLNNGEVIKCLYFNEKGVGLNRNNGLMRACSEYIVFADDDMIFYNNYAETIKKAFEDVPDADILIFNLDGLGGGAKNTKINRIRLFNCLKYGAPRMVAKLDKIKQSGILFNLCFGGGAEYCHGEDTLFLVDCIKKNLKIYSYPKSIATLVDIRKSTWNSGYDLKYMHDQGVLYKQISRKFWKLLCLQDAIRHRSKYKKSWIVSYKEMLS